MYDDSVNAPTGGPNSGFEPTRRNRRRKRAWLVAGCAALSYWVLPIGAAAETQLRVTGGVTIEASASQLTGGSELDARLLDDAGHAVSGGLLQIKPLNGVLPSSA